MKTQLAITDYEIIDHGYEHEQYFQGCGVSFTRWDECVTGCGETPHEALEDALDQIAGSSDLSLDAIVNDLSEECEARNNDFNAYVSVRFMLPAGARGFN